MLLERSFQIFIGNHFILEKVLGKSTKNVALATLQRASASAPTTPRLCRRTSPVMKLAGVKATIAGDAASVYGPLWRGREVVHGRKRVPRLRQNQKLVEIDVRVPLTAYLELLVSEEDAAAVGVLRC